MLAAGIGTFLPLLCSFGVFFNLLFISLRSFL
ncbi:unnamed protein product [Cuscuta epithymum]|uniref:Uncharacterized protein n=1 Tax=Cuscuta epithymum TaxID=186058 RepID=A0AAV0EPG1_9ASTE|nr:unnamed protein product [Cuscuta epithymum]